MFDNTLVYSLFDDFRWKCNDRTAIYRTLGKYVAEALLKYSREYFYSIFLEKEQIVDIFRRYFWGSF